MTASDGSRSLPECVFVVVWIVVEDFARQLLSGVVYAHIEALFGSGVSKLIKTGERVYGIDTIHTPHMSYREISLSSHTCCHLKIELNQRCMESQPPFQACLLRSPHL